MGFDNVTAKDLSGTDAAIIRTLWTWKTSFGPTVDLVVLVEKRVLLFQSEPSLMLCVRFHQPGSVMTVVELVRSAIIVPALGQDKDIGRATERIRVNGDGADIHVGVVTASLASRGAIEIPFRQVLKGFWLALESLQASSVKWRS